jgi:hypothetical protein
MDYNHCGTASFVLTQMPLNAIAHDALDEIIHPLNRHIHLFLDIDALRTNNWCNLLCLS